MASQEGPSQAKKRLTRYWNAMANEHPFIKRCSKHVNDYEYKFHCSICNINLSCNHGGINYMRDHVGKDKHKAAKKNQTVSSSTFILIWCLVFLLRTITRYMFYR